MTTNKNYVQLDQGGAYRVGSTRVSLDSVVHAFLQGCSAETIADQYPALALEEVYGAIAFYLANRENVDQYLKRQDELWAERRAKAEAQPSPVVQRLRALRQGAPQGKP